MATRFSITDTSSVISLNNTGGRHSAENLGPGTVYYRKAAATAFAGDASTLQAAADGEIAAGACVTLPWKHAQIDVVCATAASATAKLTAGDVSIPVNIEANLGNVGLLNAAESEVNPATEDKQDTIITTLGTPAQAGEVAAAIPDPATSAKQDDVLTIMGTTAMAAGAVDAYTQRIVLASNDPAVALLTTIDANTDAIKTAVQLIDNAIAGTEMQVDVVAALPAGDNNIGNMDIVTLPAGNLGQQLCAASLSVTPATDVADATYIGDIKFGEALPAGTNAIGKLAANTGVDIGDVDVLSLPALATGSNAIGKLAANSGVDIGDVDVLSCALPAGAATETSVAAVAADTGKIVDTKTIAHSDPACGSSTTELLASNADRKSALLQNISDEAVYIKLGVAAVASEGILIPPLTNGVPGTFEMSAAFGNLTTLAINGICASGSKEVLVTEFD